MRQQNTQKKNNRRSIFVIGLLLMLVAVIGFGGYTLSKYVTKKSTDANATVAKWGFTVDANASGLFGKDYAYDTTKANSIVNDGTGALTVSASANRVAPGTTGSMTFNIKGSAEVLAQIKIEMTVTSDVVLNYTKDGTAGTAYTPVKWTLTKKGETNPLVQNGTLEAVKNALNKTTTYQANSTAIDEEYTLTWAWAFETGTTDEEKTLNNNLDTLLGMVANADGAVSTNEVGENKFVSTAGTSTAIAFDLAITIEQLQQDA